MPEGVQVTWSGSDDASYIVTVLSAEAPPEALPATSARLRWSPTSRVPRPAQRCFTVTPADEAGAAAGAASSPACMPGATAEQMQLG